MSDFNFNYRGFPRRNIINDRRFGGGVQSDSDLQRLNDQMISLRREIQTLSSSVLNLYNISQLNSISISNIEHLLQNRFNRMSRNRPFNIPNSNSNLNRVNSLQQELMELERLTNLISRIPPNQPRAQAQPETQAQPQDESQTQPINLTSTSLNTPNNETNVTNTTNSTNTTNTLPPLPTLNNLAGAEEPMLNTTKTLNMNNPPRLNSDLESVLFNTLVDSLNRPRTRPRASFIHPNILEVTYTPENLTGNLANIFRDINIEEDSTNVITTHATISRNTEIIVRESQAEGEAASEQSQEEEEVEGIQARTLDNFCVICHENINEGQVLRKITKCGHTFHIECLDRWLENKITCPTCRTDIRLNTDNNGNEINQPQGDNQPETETHNQTQNQNQNNQINISR